MFLPQQTYFSQTKVQHLHAVLVLPCSTFVLILVGFLCDNSTFVIPFTFYIVFISLKFIIRYSLDKVILLRANVLLKPFLSPQYIKMCFCHTSEFPLSLDISFGEQMQSAFESQRS